MKTAILLALCWFPLVEFALVLFYWALCDRLNSRRKRL